MVDTADRSTPAIIDKNGQTLVINFALVARGM
jgi:hypothetical protein